ncbi:MAG: hypothetical protein M5U25_20895 [Planctomycetota bacterium]|nr:hypothetical protein [Planctomycetota bacterium]
MPKHDYAELARTLVRAGCCHISEEHCEKGKPLQKLLVEAALTAQRNLVIQPEYAFKTEDLKAVTREIECFKDELNIEPSREPKLHDDSCTHLRKLRSALAKTISRAASLCTQDTLPQVTELLGKVWEVVQEAENEAIALSQFRNQLTLAFIAEFKHAANSRRN